MEICGATLVTPDLKPELGDVAKDKAGRVFVWDGTSWIDNRGHAMPEGNQLEVVWHPAI